MILTSPFHPKKAQLRAALTNLRDAMLANDDHLNSARRFCCAGVHRQAAAPAYSLVPAPTPAAPGDRAARASQPGCLQTAPEAAILLDIRRDIVWPVLAKSD